MSNPRILIIEDDTALSDVLSYNLTQAGYEVTIAADGREGLEKGQTVAPDLIVLDIMLPLIDGVEVCRRLRTDTATKNVLIVMLTAKSEEVDQVVGFSVGADDYVTKPFSVKVLVQRIKALLRRRDNRPDDRDTVDSEGLVLDRRRHRATLDGTPVDFTRSEFSLLDTLIRQPGRAFTRSELITSGLGDDALVLERTIDVHIRAIRKKLGDRGDLIETVRGIGYRFRDSRDE